MNYQTSGLRSLVQRTEELELIEHVLRRAEVGDEIEFVLNRQRQIKVVPLCGVRAVEVDRRIRLVPQDDSVEKLCEVEKDMVRVAGSLAVGRSRDQVVELLRRPFPFLTGFQEFVDQFVDFPRVNVPEPVLLAEFEDRPRVSPADHAGPSQLAK